MIAQRTWPQILGTLAIAQAVLVAITWWPTDPAANRLHPLLALERDAITEIEIAARPSGAAEPVSVQLAREEAGWVVRSSASYPASPEKIEALLDQLLSLEVGTPIATQASSHNALEVGVEEYGRRIDLATDSERVSLRVGAATSKSVNVRVEDEGEVYRAAGVSEWSFRDLGSSYYDPIYVEADPAELSAVSVRNAHGTLRFEKKSDEESDEWTLAGLVGNESADSAKIEGLLKQLTKLRLVEPVGKTVRTEYGLDGGLRVDWTAVLENQSTAGGYKVGADLDTNSYVKAVDSPFVVTVRQTSFDPLRNAKRADFLKPVALPE